MIVATEVPGVLDGSMDGAHLIAVDQDKPGNTAKVLTSGFDAACSPALSHDARHLFFQGRKEKDDKWQIWVLDLNRNKTSRVTELEENCIHPAPLPDGSVIFSRELIRQEKIYQELFRCNMDGTELTQVTFNLGTNRHPSVLSEGRILYIKDQVMMVMRPDGTKSEIYHRGDGVVYPVSKGSESREGYAYFTNNSGQLMRVLHNRPLHTAEILFDAWSGKFNAVVSLEGNSCLVSYRPAVEGSYALYKVNSGSQDPPGLWYKGNGNITEPVIIRAMPERPRILPSAVNPDRSTGLLMSQDINHSMLPVHPGLKGDSLASRVRLSGEHGELAVLEAKEDGSFYLEMDADSPVRIETLNELGETVRGPSDWIYLRPNERRGCVGCHADPELAPENIQPFAVKEPPVVITGKKMDSNY